MKQIKDPTRIIALSIGESFAEVSLYCQKQKTPIHFERWYLPKEPLKSSLKGFIEKWGQDKDHPISKVFVSSRFLEKILTFKLGNSVAQLVTAGFEHWPFLRQPSRKSKEIQKLGLDFVNPDEIQENTLRYPYFAADELIFGINERITATGDVEIPLQIEDLDPIINKLKELKIEKVVINFLHSDKNSTHLRKVSDYLSQKGFEVFNPLNSSNDEVANWRQNTLNASVAGTFNEIRNEIIEAVNESIPQNNIFFVTSPFTFFSEDNSLKINSIFAGDQSIKKVHKKVQTLEKHFYLLFGLERFTLLSLSDEESYWQSPWGKVAISKVKRIDLNIQPTSALFVNDWGDIDFTLKKEGFEPGPMSWGRGQLPIAYDLFATHDLIPDDLKHRVIASGAQKFDQQLLTLSKNSNLSKMRDLNKIKTELIHLFKNKLFLDLHLHCQKGDQLHVGGLFAPVFFNDLKSNLTDFKFTTDNQPINKSEILLTSLGIEHLGQV